MVKTNSLPAIASIAFLALEKATAACKVEAKGRKLLVRC